MVEESGDLNVIKGMLEHIKDIIQPFKPLMNMLNTLMKMVTYLLAPVLMVVTVLLMPILRMLRPIVIMIQKFIAPFRKLAFEAMSAGAKKYGAGDTTGGMELFGIGMLDMIAGVGLLLAGMLKESITLGITNFMTVLGTIFDLLTFGLFNLTEKMSTVANLINSGIDSVYLMIADSTIDFLEGFNKKHGVEVKSFAKDAKKAVRDVFIGEGSLSKIAKDESLNLEETNNDLRETYFGWMENRLVGDIERVEKAGKEKINEILKKANDKAEQIIADAEESVFSVIV